LAEHRAAHHSMLAQMLQPAHRVQYGEGVEMRAFLCFLRDQYIVHIESFDRQYGPWLNEHGVL
jgi:hemerythrin